MVKKVSSLFAALAALTLFLQPLRVVAGTITIFDLTETVTSSVSADIAARVSGGCVGELCSFTIQNPAGTVGASYSAPTNIFGPNGPLSDIFQFLNGAPTFQSDSETGPPLVPFTFASMVEDGTVQEVGAVTFFGANNNTLESDAIFFQSDATPEAPEPSSILLTLAGFAALSIVQMNRRWLASRNH